MDPRGERVSSGWHGGEARCGGVRTDVVLAVTETAISLDEIVVTGTPQQELVRSLGNAVGRVRAEALVEIAPPPNVRQLLSVAVPGVRVMAAGGDVGSGGNIRIRGAGSMALPSEPLVYVDGVRVNNSFADQGIVGGVGVDGRYPPSRINDLNPEDMESIEVIKGPAAATLYGTEASNGVITTAIIWSCPSPGCEPGRKLPSGMDGPFRGYLAYLPERYEHDIEGYEDLARGMLEMTVNHRPAGWFSHRLTVGGDFTEQRLSELFERITGVGSLYPTGRKDVQNTRTIYASADYAATASWQATDRSSPVLLASYKEARLFIAEAAARSGDLATARQVINQLHAEAGIPGYDEEGKATQDEVIRQVLEERRRELFAEGGHRLNDHLRFRGTKFNIPFLGEAGSIHPNGVDHTGVPYGPTTCLPLPTVERAGNPNIKSG